MRVPTKLDLVPVSGPECDGLCGLEAVLSYRWRCVRDAQEGRHRTQVSVEILLLQRILSHLVTQKI